jgi:hypothetical protein
MAAPDTITVAQLSRLIGTPYVRLILDVRTAEDLCRLPTVRTRQPNHVRNRMHERRFTQGRVQKFGECMMAIQRTVKTAARPAKTAAPHPFAPAKAVVAKNPAKPRQQKAAVEDVPKVATRVMKDAEIRLVRKTDRVVTDVAHTAQVYRGMERDGNDRLQALATSYGHLFQGAEEIQQRMWDMLQQSVGSALSIPHEFAQCRSFTDVAEKQQDLIHGFFSNWVASSHAMLIASRRAVDRAIRPLEAQLAAVN